MLKRSVLPIAFEGRKLTVWWAYNVPLEKIDLFFWYM